MFPDKVYHFLMEITVLILSLREQWVKGTKWKPKKFVKLLTISSDFVMIGE